jgi:hypothetical protein
VRRVISRWEMFDRQQMTVDSSCISTKAVFRCRIWPTAATVAAFVLKRKKLSKNWLIRFKMFVSQSITKLCN